MDLNEISLLLKDENKKIDRKEGIGDAVGRTAAAMSTLQGGKILIGVTDNKVILGLVYNDSLKSKLSGILNKCDPKIDFKIHTIDFENDKVVLCLEVFENERKPVYYDGKPYSRKDGENVVCSNEEVLSYQVETGQIYFDRLPAKNKERKALLQDIDSASVYEFIALAKQQRKRNFNSDLQLEDLLFNLDLYDKKNNSINNAGMFLFGKAPQDFVNNSSISFSVFKEKEITSAPFIKQTIIGTAFKLIENTINLIKLYAPPVSKIRGIKRIDVYPYPYEVLREIVTNAVVHRDYFVGGEITVRMFSDRIEITNPGSVPRGINFDELIGGKNNISVPRNRLLAVTLDYAGQMDKAGQGFKRALIALQDSGFPNPEFPKSENSFKAIIYAGDTSTGIKKSTKLSYTKGKRDILAIILKNGSKGISNKTLIKKTGYTSVHISNMTKELENEGQIVKKRRKKEMYSFPKT